MKHSIRTGILAIALITPAFSKLDFIRSVGEAAKVLTHDQHQTLTDAHPSAEPTADPDAPDHSKH